MPHITLTEEQTRVLKEASASVEVRDPEGRPLAFVKALDPALAATIAECKRRLASQYPRIPSPQVKAFLRKCSEIDRAEGMTQAKMDDLLRRALAGEPM